MGIEGMIPFMEIAGSDIAYGGEGDDIFIYERFHDTFTIYPDESGIDELRCIDVRATSETYEGADLVLRMEANGLIRLVNHLNSPTIETIIDCRP